MTWVNNWNFFPYLQSTSNSNFDVQPAILEALDPSDQQTSNANNNCYWKGVELTKKCSVIAVRVRYFVARIFFLTSHPAARAG
jgi:hypothetical protein